MRTGASVNMPRHLRHRPPVLQLGIWAVTAAALLALWGVATVEMIR